MGGSPYMPSTIPRIHTCFKQFIRFSESPVSVTPANILDGWSIFFLLMFLGILCKVHSEVFMIEKLSVLHLLRVHNT